MSRFTPYRPSLDRQSINRPKSSVSPDSFFKVSSSKRKSGFKPSRFNSSYNNWNDSIRSKPAIVLKGGLSMAEQEIKSLLDDLRPYASTMIDALPKEAREKLGRLTTYVSLLYNTTDYNKFYQWVTERYGNLREVIPGTVGAYLAGCSIPTSFSASAPGCAVACAGSLPRPRDDATFSHCENTVVMGKFNGQEYRFTVLRKADNPSYHENAYLYIDNTDPVSYPGFSDDEKRDLKGLGINQVKLFGYHNDGRNYVELTNDLVPIDNLKARNNFSMTDVSNNWNNSQNNWSSNYQHNDCSEESVNSSGSNAIWIIVIIVIIIIIIIIIWGWSVRSRYTESLDLRRATYLPELMMESQYPTMYPMSQM